MIHSVFLRRTLLLVLATVLLSALLTAVVYIGFAQDVFARMKAAELEPTAQVVAELVTSPQSGALPVTTLIRLVAAGPEFWDAQIIVFNANGEEALGLYPVSVGGNKQLLDMVKPRVKRVLAGVQVQEIQRSWESSSDVLIVGTPVVDNGMIIGAVMLVKPMTELRAAMGGLNETLLLSMSAAFLLMLIPSYFAARKLILPIRKMQAAADAMARGDFSVRAEEKQKGEIGGLARSLNHLSAELSITIGELTREKNRLALILDGLTEGIVAVDPDGHVTRTNPAVSRLSGMKPEELQGGETPDAQETFADRSVDRIPGLRADLDLSIREGRPSVREFPFGILTLRISTSPLFDENGVIAGSVALIRDTTEAARLEKARRDYVSNVSHEFRTPVSSIRGLLEPLKDGLVPSEEDRVRYYTFMLHETERLTRLIDDLLELSRLQTGNLAFEGRPFRLPILFDEIRERFRHSIANRDIRLDIGPLSPDSPPAFGNPDRAEQVLVALVDNAFKFTPKGGQVRISATLEPDRYRVTVQDDGTGISPEDLPYVFDRFYKAAEGRGGEGSGLGLAIAREVLRCMGQTIEAESEPGKGAAFTFTLDRADRVG